MRCIIVVNAYIKNKSQLAQSQRIAEELKLLGVDCEIVKNINIAEIRNGVISAERADICVFLDKDKAAARLLEKSGARLINCAEAIEVCDDKMLTHIALANNGIPMPDSIYAPLCYYSDAQIDQNFLKQVEKLGYPLVAKKCFGSLGAGVYLINSYSELEAFEDKNKLTAHFYQKFIGNGGEDIRVIVIGGKYVCAMKRSNENDFRSNIELGGHGEKYEADKELIQLCENVAKILKLDYCGIDVLTDGTGTRYICEVNSHAFFAEAERFCNVNIAKKYSELIIT
ncbi:MAG: RimK family alpha-L-glutamate ligase, partial [Clostridia bacterium]|nr:RimK family alpha-L-glutamate ligase [Clostridia bacterium]